MPDSGHSPTPGKAAKPARILSIAGSDPSGGAGIQADIKTITALGGYAMAAITALTVQNTLGVAASQAVDTAFVAAQTRHCLDDIGADAIKTGMLYHAGIIQALAELLEEYPDIPVVIDPVMLAKGGASLLKDDAIYALKHSLLPKAFLLTPNLPEAEALTGITITNEKTIQQAATRLLQMGAKNVLIKGGHGQGDLLTDWLFTAQEAQHFSTPRIHSQHTHGTGCSMASAIATLLAQGHALPKAVQRAQTYIQNAIRHAPQFGHGHGPLWHMHGCIEGSHALPA